MKKLIIILSAMLCMNAQAQFIFNSGKSTAKVDTLKANSTKIMLKSRTGNKTAWIRVSGDTLYLGDVTGEKAIGNMEPALGNPASNGYILSSTTSGTRSWVAQSGGTTDTVNLTQNGLMSKYDYLLLIRNTPLTGQTFSGEFNLSSNYVVTYSQYTLNTTITPTISASPLKNSYCRIVIDAGSLAILVPTNLGTLRLGSDAFTPNKLNELTVIQEEEGLYYFIKLLN